MNLLRILAVTTTINQCCHYLNDGLLFGGKAVIYRCFHNSYVPTYTVLHVNGLVFKLIKVTVSKIGLIKISFKDFILNVTLIRFFYSPCSIKTSIQL